MNTPPRLTRWARCGGCAGKLDAGRLDALLRGLPSRPDPDLIVGTETGDDAGVYRIGADLAVVNTADFMPPPVDDPRTFGRIAAANALSDVYAMGGRPITAMNLVGFPRSGLADEVLHAILRGALEVLDSAGVALVGGHSVYDEEVKYGLAVTGLIHPERVVRNGGARPGDRLVLTKPIGTGVVVDAIRRECADEALIQAAVGSMTRLNREAAELMIAQDARACTDVTGFGLIGHAREMAFASRCRLRIDHRTVPLLPGVAALCADAPVVRPPGGVAFGAAVTAPWRRLLTDPQTSGGLLIAVNEHGARAIVEELAARGQAQAAVIGEVLPAHGDSLVEVV
ncbi:selenide, water dikinase SelD [Thioalkalivibrio denitrificans]|uniref:Selenide, water dikinase n=1 Tax=Thioalkalivibrio denitrificans TaxID=108003 RepID=A0A1V3NRR6_9GAMM|nr:selenide, water dikinase SelD [Thioalkalivibrio denitrificans]OOG27704.1 selenide, water dikinase SelD [Thioalkalivibrio denitrificans]